jgi:hypothetical protein
MLKQMNIEMKPFAIFPGFQLIVERKITHQQILIQA